MDAPETPVVDLPPPPGAGTPPPPLGAGYNQQAGDYTRHAAPPPPPHWQEPPRRKEGGGRFFTGCLTGCLLAIVLPWIFFGLFALIGVSAAKSVMKSDDFKSSFETSFGMPVRTGEEANVGADDFPSFREVWSCGDDEEESAKIVRVSINDVIALEESRWGLKPGTALTALQSIHRATLDEDVCGLILEIDSPGGGVTASDIIWNALYAFKEADTNRAVVVMMGDTCASGGYYISAAADCIVAHPTTLTGSIGVIIESLNIKELADKVGVKDVSIASGDNKQMLNPFHDLTEEQRKILQNAVNDLNSRFIAIVAEGRDLPREKVAEIADGRVFIAGEALKLGLVDAIGYFPDALDAMAELIGNDSLHVVRYERRASFMDMLEGEGLFGMTSGLRLLENASRTRLQYKMR